MKRLKQWKFPLFTTTPRPLRVRTDWKEAFRIVVADSVREPQDDFGGERIDNNNVEFPVK